MDGLTTRMRYRPVYQDLRIGSKTYAVLDKKLAAERADKLFKQALELLAEPITPDNSTHAYQLLTLATDFGSADAPFILALQIFDESQPLFCGLDEAVTLMKLAAERGHSEAAFRMGCSYAGMGNFIEVEQAWAHYFASMQPTERLRLAEHYFDLAVDANYQEAIEELIIAYAYGRGYIPKNIDKFKQLCEQQVENNNQAVTLGYAAWLVGMTVEGTEPLSEAIKFN